MTKLNAFNKLATGFILLATPFFAIGSECSVEGYPADIELTSFVSDEEQFNQIVTISTDAVRYLEQAQKTNDLTRIVLVRHGQSLSNINKGMAGRTDDSPLSELGISQACACGARLEEHGISFDFAYSSPMRRAKTTAELILASLSQEASLEITEDPQLHERFYGIYEGSSEAEYKPVKEAEALLNTGKHLSFEQKFNFKADDTIESMNEVYARLVQFGEETHRDHRGSTVLVGTHNALLKAAFMADSAKKGLDVEYQKFEVSNCSIVVIEVTDHDMRVTGTSGLKFKN